MISQWADRLGLWSQKLNIPIKQRAIVTIPIMRLYLAVRGASNFPKSAREAALSLGPIGDSTKFPNIDGTHPSNNRADMNEGQDDVDIIDQYNSKAKCFESI
jgi:hypothetical protein